MNKKEIKQKNGTYFGQIVDEIAEGNKYCTLRKMRLEKAKEEYKNVTGKFDLKGIYIRDLILEEMKNDDPRLR